VRQTDGVLERLASHHEAAARQHTLAERPDDRFIHGLRDTKVVSIDNQPPRPHCLLSPSRMAHQLPCVATNALRFARSRRNSCASLYKRWRSRVLKSARRTILKMIRGRK